VTTSKLWLAFDIGTTRTKAALIAENGQIIRSAYHDYPTHTAENGVVEQNAADWWQAVIETSHALVTGDDLGKIEAVALTGQMQNLILIDAEGSPIRPVILYSDMRARAEADEITRRIGVDRLRTLTGNDQGADSLLAKLLWLKRHEPSTLESGQHLLLGAADFIAFKMTGSTITDTTTASTTGLMQMNTRTAHNQSLLDEVGIGAASKLLPTITAGGSKAGELSESAATALGLKSGLPVHHGPGDAGATTIGAGSGEPGWVYAYLGTSGWIAFTSAYRALPDHGAFTLAHPQPTAYIQVAPLLTAGGNLEWARGIFGGGEYDTIIDQACARPPSNLIYLPYLNGERSPFRDPLARGTFVGIDPRTERDDFYRAILEGVIYAYRHALDALLASPPSALILTGGGTQSESWCQLFADILNLPVSIAEDAENVGVRGAVLAARVACGELSSYKPQDFFPMKATLQPNNRHRALFDHQYNLFRELYPALRPIFGRML
jgi:xylulokinase